MPSHYLNQFWNIVNSNLRNKLQWNLKRNSWFSFKKMRLKMSSGKWRQFCLGLNVLNLITHSLSGAQFTYMEQFQSSHGWVIKSLVKCGMKSLIHLHPWSLGMDKWFHPTLFYSNYLCMLGLKINHVSKRDPMGWKLMYCLKFDNSRAGR